MSLRPSLLVSVLLLIIASIAGYYVFWPHSSNPNALWDLINKQCVPNQRAQGNPEPCTYVDEQQGLVVLKDINGSLQYLLMPSTQVSGMESPVLLEKSTPNYFVQAWQARHFMAKKYGRPIDDSNISLTINSQYGRSQNQLHIHISCLSPQIKKTLSRNEKLIGYQWQTLPEKLLDHTYLARKVTPSELNEKGAFRILAEGVPDSSTKMGNFGMAMVNLQQGDFLLLASQRNLLQLNNASTEEIQDHQCQLLTPLP